MLFSLLCCLTSVGQRSLLALILLCKLRGYIRDPCFCNSLGPNLSFTLAFIFTHLCHSRLLPTFLSVVSPPTLRLPNKLRRYTRHLCLWGSLVQICVLLYFICLILKLLGLLTHYAICSWNLSFRSVLWIYAWCKYRVPLVFQYT